MPDPADSVVIFLDDPQRTIAVEGWFLDLLIARGWLTKGRRRNQRAVQKAFLAWAEAEREADRKGLNTIIDERRGRTYEGPDAFARYLAGGRREN